MEWQFSTDRPIYLQLIDMIKQKIISGQYGPGQKLQSVREMAGVLAVNPNTLQRALGELEKEGLVFTQRTNGRFITEDTQLIDEVKKQMATERITQLLKEMEQMGYSGEEVIALIKSTGKGE